MDELSATAREFWREARNLSPAHQPRTQRLTPMSSPTLLSSHFALLRSHALAIPAQFRRGQPDGPLYVLTHQSIAASCLSFRTSCPLFSMPCSLFCQKRGGGYTPPNPHPKMKGIRIMTPDSRSSVANIARPPVASAVYPSSTRIPHSARATRPLNPTNPKTSWLRSLQEPAASKTPPA